MIELKKRVFLTGVTGTMGGAGLSHLLEYKDELSLVLLIRETAKNMKAMEKYKDLNLEIIWGDLTDYRDVKRAIKDVDYIIHVAAFVSPEADYEPKKAWEINVGSIDNILKAISELALHEVKLVYIGSIAETGSRLPPIHWGRVGDPLKPSIYDNYAITKIVAERKVIESGLKYWVSLRQTGILHYGLLNIIDGIIFHQPLNNVFEWITADDSGRLLANLCVKDLPERFWKNIYNIGGGQSCRKNNYDFMTLMLSTVGIENIEKIFETNWFATKNFHGHYYLDSDILNDYLDFRRESIEDFIERLKVNVKLPTSLLRYLPTYFTKNFIMKPIAKSENGTLNWINSKDEGRINAFWGSINEWQKIKPWNDINLKEDYDKVIILNHGYDENKDENLLNLYDMKEAAKFRGGKCLSDLMIEGDLETKLKWQCSFGHEFYASPRLILKGGHWCEKCESSPSNYSEIAKDSIFFSQVWDV